MDGFGDFPDAAAGADNLNFGEDGDDAFASAAADPFEAGNGMNMNAQPDGFGAAID
tara:strand:- start:212 stop:379 length:168 start_codon:yes stop_codon:yes gene_type:complete